jgi:hypothetical protein
MSREMFHTTNLKAATALVTLGFDLLTPPVTRTVRDDGEESTVFWFEPRNSDGLKAMDVYRDMTKGSDALRAADPENPINYIREALGNRDELISLIRNTPRNVVIKRNGRSIAIREDASKEQKDQFKPYL